MTLMLLSLSEYNINLSSLLTWIKNRDNAKKSFQVINSSVCKYDLDFKFSAITSTPHAMSLKVKQTFDP